MKKNHYVGFAQSGIGLIELLISMFIGLFIMAGVVQMVGTTSQNAVVTNGISRIQENTRYALSRMEDDLHRSGNMGCFSTSTYADVVFENDEMVLRGAVQDGIRTPVSNYLTKDAGRNDKYDYGAMIGGDSNQNDRNLGALGTDSLTVRFVDQSARLTVESVGVGTLSLSASSSPTAAAVFDSLEPYKVVTLANCNSSEVFMVSGTSGSGTFASGATVTWDTNPAPASGINALQKNYRDDLEFSADYGHISQIYLYTGSTGAYRYYIDTSAFGVNQVGAEACDVGNPQYCALFRVGDGQGEELVDGVHDLEVEYGFVTAAGDLRFADADTINGLGADSDWAWNDVDRVKITLSLNSVESVPTDANTNIITKKVTRTIALFNQL